MLTPEYLLNVSDGAEEIASELHTRILKKIVGRVLRRRDKGEDYILTATDKWQIQVLQEAGYLLEDIQKEIAKYTGYQAKEIARAMEDAGVTALKYDDKIYEKAGIDTPPLKQSPNMIRLMQREYEKTLHTWENFTGTTADSCHQEFIKVMDQIHVEVMAGETSYIQAYEHAIDNLCNSGLVITYPSGYKDTLETAALRCVRTGVAQATAEMQLARMDEEGQDLVLVSSHMGARPSHQEWQGKVYSRGGTKEYPDFYESTHYGEGDGLCGWNCRHHFSPYYEGMRNPFKDYSNEENVKIYEDTQEQRRMERGIRKTKRAIEGYKEAIDSLDEGDPIRVATEAKLKAKNDLLKAQKAQYKKFCKEKGFKELPERLRIAQAGKAGDEYNGPEILEVKPPVNPAVFPSGKPEKPVEAQKEPVKPVQQMRPITPPPEPAKPSTEPIRPESREVNLDVKAWKPTLGMFGSSSRKEEEALAKLIRNTEEPSLAKTLAAWAGSSDYQLTEEKFASFDEDTNTVAWAYEDDRESSCKWSTFAHEIGHSTDQHMDSINAGSYDFRNILTEALVAAGGGGMLSAPGKKPSQSDEFLKAVQKDIANLRGGKVVIDEYDAWCITAHRDAMGVSDFLDGAFGGFVPKDAARTPGDDQNILGIRLTAGHGKEYWEEKYARLIKNGRIDRVLEELRKRGVKMSRDELKETFRNYQTAIELWANINRALVIQQYTNDEIAYLELYAPNAVSAFRKLVASHAKELEKYAEKGIRPENIEMAMELAPQEVQKKKKERKGLFSRFREKVKANLKSFVTRHK